MTSNRLALGALLIALAAAPLAIHSSYLLHVMILIFLNVMLATSMWLLGITHLISFGQAGFVFIGAMTSALLTKDLGISFWVALPISGVLAALVAAPVGRLSLRVTRPNNRSGGLHANSPPEDHDMTKHSCCRQQ